MEDKIDFVVTWVDGNDPEWQKEKNKYNPDNKKNNSISDMRNIRYRDMDCLKYWFRGIEKNAPWVNKIYFITCGQVPKWLNIDNPKLVLVNHKDYIPSKYLPTFNSNSIEASINTIKGLSDKFVYFNDDMFIINKVLPRDFFKNGLPCDSMSLEPLIIMPTDNFHKKICNDLEIINKYFNFHKFKKANKKQIYSFKQGKHLFRTLSLLNYNTFVGFHNYHLPVPYLKKTFDEVWEREKDILDLTMSFKFRNNRDSVNHWLFQYWQFASGNFVQRKQNFGKFTKISESETEKYILKSKYKIICINDTDKTINFEDAKRKIISSFEAKFPNKSSFEK